MSVESAPTREAVLDAVFGADGVEGADGVDEAAPATPCGDAAASGEPAGGSPSTPGAGRASLLAAQAKEAIRANEVSIWIDDGL